MVHGCGRQQAADGGHRLGEQIIHVSGAKNPQALVDALGWRKFDGDHRPLLASMFAAEVLKVFIELRPVRQAAGRLDPAEGMLKLDLRHDHLREVVQPADLVGRGLPRGCAKHAERTKPMSVAGDQRRPGVEPYALVGQDTVGIQRIGQQVGQDQHGRTLGNGSAGRFLARDGAMRHPHARLEPLPVAVGQRHSRDRQIEQPGRHAGDPVKAFA